ncbi:endonuclease V [Thermomicrobium sp. 4228-Ro]|uniref:endonuclease V n=1 Tax=Thermomicrobium sp. 4228-Ro TaxID=2993937 RepID=UPI0022491D1C|nr:endonuclease V [Thermomicrobium sp. 4228-Ro]MCX2726095.1 endonuclease V [Thermomicrobium sp. 4228-Ro]
MPDHPRWLSGRPIPERIPLGELERLAELQRELASKVVECRLERMPQFVAGADVHLRNETAIAVAVLLELLEHPADENDTRPLALREVEYVAVRTRIGFPYIPGFLSFREAPVVIEAVRALARAPDLLVLDGQGRAHPRGCGLASHVGVLLDIPTIGAAKSRLYGRYREPANERGAWTPITADSTVIGAAVRTRVNTKPLIVSVGHRITLPEAIRWTLRLSRYRLPEPTRLAHRYAKEAVALLHE